jgi:phage terminase large subunit GpA-like protein
MRRAPTTTRTRDLRRRAGHLLRQAPTVVGSEWADAHFRLSQETHGSLARWTCDPFQRAWIDAFTDPTVEQVILMGSSRVGKTKCLIDIPLGVTIDVDPGPTMVVHPTLDLAREFSTDEFDPMVRDCPRLRGKVAKSGRGSTKKSRTLRKSFVGGFLYLRGAAAASGLAGKTIRYLFFSEVDRYPASAASGGRKEGDPFLLALRRAQTFGGRRKIVAESTPGTEPSRIEELYRQADEQYRNQVPCPHCGVFDELVPEKTAEPGRGHWMTWPAGSPELAHFVCSTCGKDIEEHHKAAMVRQGYWEAENAPRPAARRRRRKVGFRIWAAYGNSISWGEIAKEVENTKGDPDKMRVVENTLRGRTWRLTGEAPDYMPLYDRREPYPYGQPPVGVRLLTVGVDVQRDRLVYDLVGWGEGMESWAIEYGEFAGDTSSLSLPVWKELDKLLASTWRRADGAQLQISLMGIDSGDNTQVVYDWARHRDRVMATKGHGTRSAILSAPTRVTVTVGGRSIPDGVKLWIIGSSVAKRELYGRLKLKRNADGTYPAGYCHWPIDPRYGEEYFRQLTAEQEIEVRNRLTRKLERRWVLKAGCQNHVLDARVIARAVAATAQIDRELRAEPPTSSPPSAPPPPPPRDEGLSRLSLPGLDDRGGFGSRQRWR